MRGSVNRVVLGATVLLILCPAAAAKDYYVAPDGNDANPGTLAKPMASPIRAATLLRAGDTLYFRAGLYKCRTSRTVGLAPSASGEPGKPITFKNYDNEHVKIDCTGSDWGFMNNGYSYIVIDGFDITNRGHYGMKLSAASGRRGPGGKPVFGHHITIRNCEVHHTRGECIFAHSTPNITIENCHLHDSGRSHGLYMQVGCHNAVIRNVTSENNFGNSGTQLNAAGGGIKNALVEYCLIRNNAQGWSLMGVKDSTFRRNVLINNGYDGPRHSGYREIILWTYGKPLIPCENVTFENNTIVNLLGAKRKLSHLVHVKSGTKNVTFRNNILLVRGKPVFTIDEKSRQGHAFLNNCLYNPGGRQHVSKGTTLAAFCDANKLKHAGTVGADPMFVDAAKGDVKLKAGSPCIDAGAPVKGADKITGSAPDLGALERGAEVRIGCDLPWREGPEPNVGGGS